MDDAARETFCRFREYSEGEWICELRPILFAFEAVFGTRLRFHHVWILGSDTHCEFCALLTFSTRAHRARDVEVPALGSGDWSAWLSVLVSPNPKRYDFGLSRSFDGGCAEMSIARSPSPEVFSSGGSLSPFGSNDERRNGHSLKYCPYGVGLEGTEEGGWFLSDVEHAQEHRGGQEESNERRVSAFSALEYRERRIHVRDCATQHTVGGTIDVSILIHPFDSAIGDSQDTEVVVSLCKIISHQRFGRLLFTNTLDALERLQQREAVRPQIESRTLRIDVDFSKWRIRGGWLPGNYECVVRVDHVGAVPGPLPKGHSLQYASYLSPVFRLEVT